MKLVRAICNLALNGEDIDLEGATGAIFDNIRPSILTGNRKAESGQKGGSKTEARPKQTTSKTEAKPKVDIDIDRDIGIELNVSKRFTPPTLKEVEAYCKERGNNVDAQRFIDFYSSKGWMVGKQKMKDWKASVRTWERDSKTTKPAPKPSPYIAPQQKVENSDIERMRRLIAEMNGEDYSA